MTKGRTTDPADDVATSLPTMTEIEEMRRIREIKQGHLDHPLGFETSGSYASAVDSGFLSPAKKARAIVVFEFYDRKGYLPVVEVR